MTDERTRKERFAVARARRALELKEFRARNALVEFRRFIDVMAHDPRCYRKDASGVSPLDIFQSADALLNKQINFCCSDPEQYPIFFDMHQKALDHIGRQVRWAEAVL